MNYIEITAAVATADAERASDAMRSVTGGGVWIETPFTQADLESDAIISTNGASLVRGYLADGGGSAAMLSVALLDALVRTGIAADITQREVAEEDWAEAWKEYFHVERFGERIVVVPSWRQFDAQRREVVLTLDPGMAFGTGQHETTRMCLEALERRVEPGLRVLDVGCGSGILSIAAAKLGAREVVAVDIDPNCVRVTDDNARANGVEQIVHAAAGSLGEEWPFDEPASAQYAIVVANIIARVIVALAPAIVAALAPGGRLIASGIIAAREDEVVAALSSAGMRVESSRTMGEWRCIEALRS